MSEFVVAALCLPAALDPEPFHGRPVDGTRVGMGDVELLAARPHAFLAPQIRYRLNLQRCGGEGQKVGGSLYRVWRLDQGPHVGRGV